MRDEKLYTQIHGGITSRSPFFALFVAIYDFDFSVIFEAVSRFSALVPPKKCTLIVSVNRMPLLTFTHVYVLQVNILVTPHYRLMFSANKPNSWLTTINFDECPLPEFMPSG